MKTKETKPNWKLELKGDEVTDYFMLALCNDTGRRLGDRRGGDFLLLAGSMAASNLKIEGVSKCVLRAIAWMAYRPVNPRDGYHRLPDTRSGLLNFVSALKVEPVRGPKILGKLCEPAQPGEPNIFENAIASLDGKRGEQEQYRARRRIRPSAAAILAASKSRAFRPFKLDAHPD